MQTGDPVEGGVPCVRVVDIASRDLKRDSMITTSHEISAAYSRTVLKTGDLMIALRGIIGQTAQATRELEGCNLTRGIARISPKAGTVTSDFLLQSLNGPEFKSLINRQANGSALQEISIATLRKAPVLLPPISEQKRIAETLQTWDRAIDTVEALIANARAQKQALMQQLLSGKRRLPGFSEPWAWAAFADVFDRVKTKNAEGNTNVLTISAQHGLISQVEYFNKSVASDDVRGYTLLQRGDFAYNKSYSDGYPMGAIKPLDRYDSGIVSSLYICFRLTRRGCDHDFFRHYFEAGLFNREIAAIAQEGARNHGLLNVSVVEFFETSLHIPQPDEQAAIAKVINAAEAEEQSYQAQLTALRQEKAALMQQLLTGKRRVKLPESEVA
ncbi:restriction endonuclease subunit S [Sphingomonas changnyeongensis]|uniref:restriction endonuclease subunit S n=1 Tax=Sphingomonas changnyeongensis TaxID=2698679 RepID=UPI001E4B2F33|nr:restriction endonuclease subunit S [Sphingomonas changnyeongensis]